MNCYFRKLNIRKLKTFLSLIPSLMVLGNLSITHAVSNSESQLSNQIFTPYVEQIKTQLPPGLIFRLPGELPNIDNNTESNYRIKISPSLVNAGMTVSIFNCKLDTQACLLGSFSVNSPKSLGSQEELKQHENLGEKITINNKNKEIRGYLINGQKQEPPSEFSSIMWEQDGLISRVRIRNNKDKEKPQNLLTIATSMATATPIIINSVDKQTSNTTATKPQIKPQIKPVQPGENPANTTEPTTQQTEEIATKPEITQPIKPIQPIQTAPEEEPQKVVYVPIRLINIKGNNALTQEQLTPVIEKFEKEFEQRGVPKDDWENQTNEIANAINNLYQKKGYMASAKPEGNDNIDDGIININVTESLIADIKVQGTEKLKSYIISRLQIMENEPVNTIKIEEKLRLLSQDPLFKEVNGELIYTNNANRTLVVTVKEAPALTTNITVDNNSPESVGSEKMTVGVNYRNLIGVGDKISASYIRTFTGGINLFDIDYEVPINSMDGKLQFRTALNFTRITQSPFDELNIRGEKQIYEVFYRQPIVKNYREELALSLGFSLDNGRTFVFDKPTGFGLGPDKDGLTRTSTIVFRQDYKNIDNQGRWYLASEFKIGTGLFNPTTNKEPVPDGYFFSWNGQIQRLQKITNSNYLVFKANLQLTPDGLLPAHQFIVGGGDTVRGYRQNARSGDNGFYFSIEDRISLNSQLQIAPFLDLGKVWNADQNPNELAKQTFLMSSGLGVIWQPLPNLSLRVDYAFPFTNLDDKGNNIQDNGWYFLLNYQP